MDRGPTPTALAASRPTVVDALMKQARRTQSSRKRANWPDTSAGSCRSKSPFVVIPFSPGTAMSRRSEILLGAITSGSQFDAAFNSLASSGQF